MSKQYINPLKEFADAMSRPFDAAVAEKAIKFGISFEQSRILALIDAEKEVYRKRIEESKEPDIKYLCSVVGGTLQSFRSKITKETLEEHDRKCGCGDGK